VDDLVDYYQTVVRPVLEYASTLAQCGTPVCLEDIQCRALQIIVGCCVLCIQSLADRQSELRRTLFKQIVNNELHSLHYLLPAKCDTQLIS